MSEQTNMCRPGFERGDYVYIGHGTYKGFIGRYYCAHPAPYVEGYTDSSMIELIMWDKSPVKIMPRSTCELAIIHDSCYDKINIDQLQIRYDGINCKINYLEILRNLYKQDDFYIAKEAKDYKPAEHDGLIYYNCLCIRGKDLEQKLRSIEPSSSLKDCVSTLISIDALKMVRNKYTVQINSIGGIRFYAIKLSKLE